MKRAAYGCRIEGDGLQAGPRRAAKTRHGLKTERYGWAAAAAARELITGHPETHSSRGPAALRP